MVSNDCKEKCRDFGMLVENISISTFALKDPIKATTNGYSITHIRKSKSACETIPNFV